jgi:beta-lactamase class C
MNKKKFLPVVLFLLLVTTSTQQIASSPDVMNNGEERPLTHTEKEVVQMQGLFDDYNQWLTHEITASGTVGAAVAVIYKDQLALLKCFGTKEAGQDAPVDEHTLFRLASVSKTITGTLAGILARQQLLDFDERVVDILPGFCLYNPENTSNLTVRNLLSHTTGLIPHAYDDLVEDYVSFCTIYDRLKQAPVSAPPGMIYSYQNVMFGLVDTIMTVKTSRDYGQLVHEKLFSPLGMYDASTDFESFRNSANKALPHRGWNGQYNKLPLNDRYYNVAPAAGVNASISDMAQFLLALLDNENLIIDDEIREQIFFPQVVTPLSRGYFKYWDRVDKKQYALGWRIIDYKGRNIAYHGGYVNGYKSEIALCREENLGIVYLTNSPNNVASQSIPVFLNSYFDYKANIPVMVRSEETSQPQG